MTPPPQPPYDVVVQRDSEEAARAAQRTADLHRELGELKAERDHYRTEAALLAKELEAAQNELANVRERAVNDNAVAMRNFTDSMERASERYQQHLDAVIAERDVALARIAHITAVTTSVGDQIVKVMTALNNPSPPPITPVGTEPLREVPVVDQAAMEEEMKAS